MRTFSSAENRRRVRRWISRTTCSVLAPLPIGCLLPVGPGVSLSSDPYVVHIALTPNMRVTCPATLLFGRRPGPYQPCRPDKFDGMVSGVTMYAHGTATTHGATPRVPHPGAPRAVRRGHGTAPT